MRHLKFAIIALDLRFTMRPAEKSGALFCLFSVAGTRLFLCHNVLIMTEEEARVTLKVNSEEAKREFDSLEKKAGDLRKKFAEAFRRGDTTAIRDINKELNHVNNRMERLRTNAANVRAAMQRVNEATPKELQRTIKQINSELNSGRVKRGSEEWKYYIEKLKEVQAELKKVNSETRETEGLLSRINRKFNDWGASVAAGMAAFAGVIMSGKAAVKAYADMQTEEANVRKYTGMTADEVKQLNDEFKRMDTRSSREELNRLAQEAGRLGKTSQEDVLGFVRAADKINVALDDLGEGATLTLSKLTSIFGDEQRLGTEKALLSVGSVINELSQNCTASAPYLAEFSKRLAGVGAQAKMTVPQIMSFAAVLDSQGQNVEASATALSQLILSMYKDPAKIAKAAGMDVKKFSEILKRDANEALLTLLNTLKSYGGIESLATVLEDMGSDGARASSVIAALAGNVDTLVWEQNEANKAFKEATSVGKEFDVQNTTVQANLDKARKGFTEMAVTLGEKLVPVMSHCISGTSMLMRVLNILIDFVSEHHKAILTATTAIIAYNLVINAGVIKMKLASAWTATWSLATSKLSGVAAIGKIAIAAMTNAVQYFTNGLRVNYTMQARWRKAMAAMNIGSWTGLILAAASAIYLLYSRTKEMTTAQERLAKIRDEAMKKAGEEISRIKHLAEIARDEYEALDERKKAVEELNRIVPEYNAQIDQTTGKYRENKEALDNYIDSLIRLYEIEGAKEQLRTLGKEKSEVTVSMRKARKSLDGARKTHNSGNGYTYTTSFGSVGNTAYDSASFFQSEVNDLDAKLKEIEKKEKEIIEAYGTSVLLQKTIEANDAISNVSAKTPSDIKTGLGESERDRKAREKAERERKKAQKEEEEAAQKLLKEHIDKVKALRLKEEAQNLSAYATGQKNYLEYVSAKEEIDRRYAEESMKVLEDHGKKETSAYAQLLKKREEIEAESTARRRAASEMSLELEHSSQENELMTSFYDPSSSMFQNVLALNQKLLSIDVLYLARKRDLYEKGSLEWARINRELTERLESDQLSKQKETAEAYSAFVEQYRKSSGSSREKAELEMLETLHELGLISEEEYQKALWRIKQKYVNEDKEKREEIKSEYGSMVAELYDSWKKFFDGLGQMGADFWADMTKATENSVAVMGAFLGQYTSYVNAERDAELAKIENRYDKEIEAAGNNKKKKESLEKQKETDLAKTRRKYAQKTQKLEIAQAVAETAQAAISAYASALQVGGMAGLILAPIAAAMATAFGMMQVATIKKQHAAEMSGYYSGGFTGRDPDNRREVGVVHANEFVANHKAVANPELSPVLNLIDKAQRSNTVGSLTAEDVSNVLGITRGAGPGGGLAQPSDTQSAVAESMAALTVLTEKNRETIDRLSRQIEQGIDAFVIMDGEKGLYRQLVKHERIINNPKR